MPNNPNQPRLKGKFIPQYNKQIIWPQILTDISNGMSLISAIKKHGLDYSTAKLHLRDNELNAEYQKAIEYRADYLADELVEITDQQMPADIDPKLANAWVQQQKLKIDARKWTAAKLRPRVYGERLDVSVSHTQISITSALERANQRLEVIDITPTENRLESPKIQSELSQDLLSQKSIIKAK